MGEGENNMTFRRWMAALMAAGLLAVPVSAWAHDDYDDPFENHPFLLAAEAGNICAYAVDQLVFRPFHWMLNQKPVSTATGHDAMTSRTPPPDIENIH
jgi:hypothetical protein